MSVTIILRTNKKMNKRGQFPLAIQIIRNGKAAISHIGEMIRPDEWDGAKVIKSHPNSVRLNNKIRKALADATDKSLEFENVSAKHLREKVKPTGSSTFFGQAEIYLNTLEKSKKFNRYSADKPRIKHFKEFAGDINFSEITPVLLEKFKAYLIGNNDSSERTAMNHMVVIRSVFSQAIKDKVVDPKYYPFGKQGFKIKFPATSKIGLNRQEVEKVETAELPTYENDARNIWLTSYYFAGMRISDVLRLQWADLADGRLHYVMGKNNKGGSLLIPDKAKKILDQYRENDPTHDLIFSDLKGLPSLDDNFDVQRRIKCRVHEINDRLKIIANKLEITKPLTNHISRHTFAQLAGDKIPLPVLQKLYRHSNISTTVAYQSNFTNDDTDNALNLVLNP